MMSSPCHVIMDFDDFSEGDNCLDVLYRMKAHWPKFRTTLFTIPARCSLRFLKEVGKLDWIELAIHGWSHTPVECEDWDEKIAFSHISNALGMGVFKRGFKAPQWRLSQGILTALDKLGDFWVADNADPASNPFNVPKPESLMYYYANGDDICPGFRAPHIHRLHGHIGYLPSNNDIRQMIHKFIDEIPQEAKFYSIDELVRRSYGVYTGP